MTRPAASPFVLALGGNAISPTDADGDIPHQFATTRRTAGRIADLVAAGHRPLLTHGNGPQVGNVLRRVELAAHEVYTLPLQTCVADTQGGMGYMIAECLDNELRRRGIQRTAATVITMVEVAPDDPAFARPTKPIGAYYTPEQAREMQRRYGWVMAEMPDGRWRRVVPSPAPQRVVEIETLRRLVHAGELIIAAGGGGIPVVRTADGDLAGVEAVIDKDRTSALLAVEIGAELLVIATQVPQVALDFGKPRQRFVKRLRAADARRCLRDQHFPPGSMGPKIEAALDFLERAASPAPRVVICALDELDAAIAGRAGTLITR